MCKHSYNRHTVQFMVKKLMKNTFAIESEVRNVFVCY